LERYDSIIVGAGHNGLVCAAYLARSGQKVLVLEASSSPGGLATTREFHPGFSASVAHSVSHFSAKVASDLQLGKHGFDIAASEAALIGLGESGQHVRVDSKSVTGVRDDDVQAYRTYQQQLSAFANALAPFWEQTIPRIGPGSLRELLTFAQMGLNIRKLGKQRMQEFMRIASLPARDLMDENFTSELLKATLSWDGLIGSRMAPRSPNSSVLVMLYRMAQANRDAHAINVRNLVSALTNSATESGVDIRCNAPVEKILVESSDDGTAATGVITSDGVQIAASHVVSATDPQRTFVNLVGVEYLDIGFTNRIRRLRCDGLVGKLHIALDGLPEFTGLDSPDGRLLIAPDLDAIEFAFDDAKYGGFSAQPVMEVVIPSLSDTALAPSGKHVLSAHVMYVPNQLKGGWADAAKNKIREHSIDQLARYAPNIREQIVHSEFLTPADLEHDYHVTGGHWHHTEFAMDQMLMMRPTYGAAQYRTPIPGLFLCGAGCHPGGDLVGAAGHNAAHEMLR